MKRYMNRKSRTLGMIFAWKDTQMVRMRAAVVGTVLGAIAGSLLLGRPFTATAEVTRIEVHDRREFADGMPFGSVGPYEAIRGRMHMEVDPKHPANQSIADLDLAPTNARGLVEFWSDFFLLKPVDPLRGNRRLLYDVNNRGNMLALQAFNRGERSNDPRSAAHAGDGFLLRQGYTLLWCGCNGDVVDDGTDRLLVGLPVAMSNGEPVRGQVHVEVSVDEPAKSWTFGWSPWGTADAYGTVDLNDPDATLTKRPTRNDEATVVPRDEWEFARYEDGAIIPDARGLYVEEGLEPGWLYDLVFTSEAPRVAGLGLVAIRDAVSHFRYAANSPVAEAIDYAYVFGISQSGRVISQFLYDGLNTTPRRQIVFDGAMAHVAGSGRGMFNHRFGLATLYGTHHRDNLVPTESFPFTTVPQRDPISGREGETLAKARANDHIPKMFFIQSSTEYWSRGASLLHTDVEGKTDVEPDPRVRIYLTSSSQHLGGGPHTRGIGQQPRNVLDDRSPVFRALLVALDQWVGEEREPPASWYPQLADGTLVSVEEFRDAFPAIPDVNLPTSCYTPRRLNLGPRWESEGIADIVPPEIGEPYRTLVPQVDSDGNELAGIRLPDVEVPLGTFTGWNLRAAEFGAETMLAGLEGSYLPFATTARERDANIDPRRSVRQRYPTRADYLSQYLEATMDLVSQRLLLPEDALLMLRDASERDYWSAEE
jgi:hypothetical protein